MVKCGTIQVGDSFDPSAVSITDCAVTDPEAEPGGRITIDFTVSNSNDTAALFDVLASVGGSASTDEGFHVGAGSSSSYTVRPTVPDSGGEYQVNLTLRNVREFEGD